MKCATGPGSSQPHSCGEGGGGTGANKVVLRRLKHASILCTIFLLVEVVGGYMSGSLAILSDAAHLFSDLAAFLVAIGVAHVAEMPPSEKNTYGYKRAEALGALFSMASLVVVSLILLAEAFVRLYKNVTLPIDLENQSVDGKVMSYIAGFGVIVNVCLAFILKENHVHLPGYHDHSHDHGHHGACQGHSSHGSVEEVSTKSSEDHTHGTACQGHSHGHSHGSDVEAITPEKPNHNHEAHDHSTSHSHDHGHDAESHSCSGHKSHGSSSHQHEDHPIHADERTPMIGNTNKKQMVENNINLNAAYMHVIGDLIQSVAVLIAGLVIYFKPTWYIVDTLCTILFCLLVGYSCIGIMKSSISVLLNEVPPNVNWQKVYDELSSIDDITNVHDLHIWSIAHDAPILSVHASTNNVEKALENISKICKEKFGIHHSTIQLQPTNADSNCITCDI